MVTLRRVGEVPGDSADAVIARAERQLEDGDLTAALAALDTLPPAARNALAPWRERAEGRAVVDRRIAEIRSRRPHFVGMARLSSDRRYRVNQLREWLAGEPAYGFLSAADIETLSNDPPLPFFILFEAMQQAEGLHLGLLGSIIVSEVIFGALASDPRSADGGSLAERLHSVSREFYLANVLEDIPEISSMAQLVEFTTEIAGLRQAVPAFL